VPPTNSPAEVAAAYWADNQDVITWFELRTATAGPLPVVNWSHVEDGLITRIRVTFDPRPLLR
jgi:hypothetical protein